MKKILFIHLFVVIVNYAIAQEKADWFTKNLDAYVGTWEFQSDTCTFRLYFKKGKSYVNKGGRLREEIIYGGHYVKRNGIVIIDLEEAMKTANDEDPRKTIIASNGKEEESQVDPNVLTFVFRDDLKDKRGYGRLTLISGEPLQLRWQILERGEMVYITIEGVDPPPPPIPRDWTAPTDVILTKIADGFPDPTTPPTLPGHNIGNIEGQDPDIAAP